MIEAFQSMVIAVFSVGVACCAFVMAVAGFERIEG